MPFDPQAIQYLKSLSEEEQAQVISNLSDQEQDELIGSLQAPEQSKEKNILKSINDFAQGVVNPTTLENFIGAAVKKYGPEKAKQAIEAYELREGQYRKNNPAFQYGDIAGGIGAGIVNPAIGVAQAAGRLGAEAIEKGPKQAIMENKLDTLVTAIPALSKANSALGATKVADKLRSLVSRKGVLEGTGSNKLIQKVTGLAEKVERKDILPEAANEIAEVIASTPGITVKKVDNVLAARGKDLSDEVKGMYKEATELVGNKPVISMSDVVKGMEEESAKLINDGAKAGKVLAKQAKELSNDLLTGKMNVSKTPEEAWKVLKTYGNEAKFDMSLNSSQNTANLIRRGIARKVVDESIGKTAGQEVLNRLKDVNRRASLNIKAQNTIKEAPDNLKNFTPSTREYIMLGLGGLGNSGTLGKLAGVSAASRVVDPVRFAAAKFMRKASNANVGSAASRFLPPAATASSSYDGQEE